LNRSSVFRNSIQQKVILSDTIKDIEIII
jgi:hypothetical protein